MWIFVLPQCSYKQTQAEAHTLASVKQQLDKVDNLLSQDVSVLRDKIEEANRDYNNARKDELCVNMMSMIMVIII